MQGVRRVAVAITAAIAPVQFLVLDPDGWYPFGPIRWFTGSVLVLAALAAVLATGRVVVERRTAWVWAALVVLIGVGAARGLDARYAWTGTPERMLGWVTWLLFLAAFVVGQALARRPRADDDLEPDAATDRAELLLFGGLVLAALGVGLAAVAEALGVEAAWMGVGGDRLTATLGNASYLGAVGALLLPTMIGVAADRTRSTLLRCGASVAAMSVVVAVVGSGARAAWVGLVSAAVTMACVRRRAVRSRTLMLGVGLACIACVAVASFTPAGGRLASSFDGDAAGGIGRLDEWRVASRVIGSNPVSGVGPEGYRIAFEDAVDASYQREHGRTPLPDRAHSAPLDVALAGGLAASAAYIVLLVLVGGSCVRVLGRGSSSRAGLAAGLVAHGVGSLLLFPTFEIDLVVWLLAGAVVAWDLDRESPDGGVRSVRVPLAASGVVVGATVVACVLGWSGVRADRLAERSVGASTDGRTEAAVADADAAVRLRPDVLRYHLLAARMGIAAGEGWSAAVADVDAALRVSPGDPIARRFRVDALVRRARSTLAPAHVEAARVAVDRLIADDPLLGEAWLLDGDLSGLEGDDLGAVAAYERAAVLEPRSVEPLLRLHEVYLRLDEPRRAASAIERALAIDPTDPRVLRATGGG